MRRTSNPDADDRSAPSHKESAAAAHNRRRRSSAGADNSGFEGMVEQMDNDALLAAHEELMNAIMEEEEELVSTHRKEIEDGMEILREVSRRLLLRDVLRSEVKFGHAHPLL
jgi:hypothetical protein